MIESSKHPTENEDQDGTTQNSITSSISGSGRKYDLEEEVQFEKRASDDIRRATGERRDERYLATWDFSNETPFAGTGQEWRSFT